MNKKYIRHLLEKENSYLKHELNYLRSHEVNLKETHENIHSSKAYRLFRTLKKVGKGISLLSNPKTLAFSLKTVTDVLKGKKTSLSSLELSADEQKYITLQPSIASKKIHRDVTIIIPTLNGEADLARLLKAIQAQQRLENPELLIIDSGSVDGTLAVAKAAGATIMKIKPAEFNHGITRNQAAEKAKGKYIIFTVQDQIPTNRDTFAELLDLLKKDKITVAASTRQIPFPDADAFGKWQILNHVNALNLRGVNFTMAYPNENFLQEPFILKRKLALLDDVCCAVRKQEFFALGGYKKVDFAEDVDLAIRALKNGNSLGFLGTNGVIHSHTRPSTYFLKRSFADVNTVHTMFQERAPSIFTSLDELLTVATKLYSEKLSSGKNDPLRVYFSNLMVELHLKKADNASIQNAEQVFWELFSNIRAQGLGLLVDEHISEGEAAEFAQKLFSSLIGSQIGLYMLDENSSKSEEQIALVKKVLLDNV